MGEDKKHSSGIDLDNREFLTAMSLLETTNRSVFLTGKAGTGKSTFLRHITENTPKKHVVLAPTGIAAVNVGGQNINLKVTTTASICRSSLCCPMILTLPIRESSSLF